MLEDLYEAARRVWYSLTPADRLDAYSRNVKMEPLKPPYLLQMRTFTGPVNAQPDTSDKDIDISFADAKRLYEDKFGFIFVLCVKEMPPAEALAICRARHGNSVLTEMRIAAAEQLKIIEINLDKLLEQ